MIKKLLIIFIVILFLITVVNFIGINEKFNVEKNDNINSNIVILNRILEKSNNKDPIKKYNTLTSFNL
jgi:hypothetical protein